MSLAVEKVAPIGEQTVPVFGRYSDGSPFYKMRELVYPFSPESKAFREFRVHTLGLGLRESARSLGIRAVELSGLEQGRFTCDWAEARRLLAENR